jgi:hypothetical protein
MICSGVLVFLGTFTPFYLFQSNINGGLILGGQVTPAGLSFMAKVPTDTESEVNLIEASMNSAELEKLETLTYTLIHQLIEKIRSRDWLKIYLNCSSLIRDSGRNPYRYQCSAILKSLIHI